MWPFSKKPAPPKPEPLTLDVALERLAGMGVALSPGVTLDDIADGLSDISDTLDRVDLLCVLGGQGERGKGGWHSTDIWHVDAECIVEDGDYIRLAERFIALANGRLPLTGLRDHVDLGEGVAWFEFELNGRKERWDLEVSDDWMDPAFYSRFQQLLARTGDTRKYLIGGLGQDSLILCGDQKLLDAITAFSGVKFQWE